jgi:hypothetical protein
MRPAAEYPVYAMFEDFFVVEADAEFFFGKKQQMPWLLNGAHLLLQTRTKVLNNDLEDVFRR